jgi:hypothetical protein
MNAEAFGFRMIVRRVATGQRPFQWQVERDDTLAVVEVSSKRYRSMQEAYEAGQIWLRGFLASRPMPKRPPLSFGARLPKEIDRLGIEPVMDLEDEDADEADEDAEVEDLVAHDHEEDAFAQPGW